MVMMIWKTKGKDDQVIAYLKAQRICVCFYIVKKMEILETVSMFDNQRQRKAVASVFQNMNGTCGHQMWCNRTQEPHCRELPHLFYMLPTPRDTHKHTLHHFQGHVFGFMDVSCSFCRFSHLKQNSNNRDDVFGC